MSILLDKTTRALVRSLTGETGRQFHDRAKKVVAAVKG